MFSGLNNSPLHQYVEPLSSGLSFFSTLLALLIWKGLVTSPIPRGRLPPPPPWATRSWLESDHAYLDSKFWIYLLPSDFKTPSVLQAIKFLGVQLSIYRFCNVVFLLWGCHHGKDYCECSGFWRLDSTISSWKAFKFPWRDGEWIEGLILTNLWSYREISALVTRDNKPLRPRKWNV